MHIRSIGRRRTTLNSFLKDASGATAIEYALIARGKVCTAVQGAGITNDFVSVSTALKMRGKLPSSRSVQRLSHGFDLAF